MEKPRPCNTCFFNYEEHKVYLDMGNIFCPNQDLLDSPIEAFDCYEPCGNLQYLEWLDKQKVING